MLHLSFLKIQFFHDFCKHMHVTKDKYINKRNSKEGGDRVFIIVIKSPADKRNSKEGGDRVFSIVIKSPADQTKIH